MRPQCSHNWPSIFGAWLDYIYSSSLWTGRHRRHTADWPFSYTLQLFLTGSCKKSMQFLNYDLEDEEPNCIVHTHTYQDYIVTVVVNVSYKLITLLLGFILWVQLHSLRLAWRQICFQVMFVALQSWSVAPSTDKRDMKKKYWQRAITRKHNTMTKHAKEPKRQTTSWRAT